MWEHHKETDKVTICSNLGVGRFQDVIVKKEKVVLGGGVMDPMELCI